jgi:hypothetical protein
LLVLGHGASQVSYGAIAGRSEIFTPGSCVEVYVDEERVARTLVTFDHSFALQFEVRGDVRRHDVELWLAGVEGEPGLQRYTLSSSTRLAARIAYEEGTTPLVAHTGGVVEFNGWLAPEPLYSSMSDVWLVNWTNGVVRIVDPVPGARVQFSAAVLGQPGDCASPISVHGDEDVVGGCWWPAGSGGCAPGCTEEQIAAGTCVSGTGSCVVPRGCAVLEVDERRSDSPPAELPESISTGRPDAGPLDAGPPDLGPPDFGPDWGLM